MAVESGGFFFFFLNFNFKFLPSPREERKKKGGVKGFVGMGE